MRVDKDRLDKLINTIGELVIAQSMAQQEFDELHSRVWRTPPPALPELRGRFRATVCRNSACRYGWCRSRGRSRR